MYELKRLRDQGYLSNSMETLVTNASGIKTQVKSISLQNNHASSAVNVQLHRVPDNAGAVGTADASNRFYNRTINPGEGEILDLGNGFTLQDTNDTIQGIADTASAISIAIDGGDQ